MMIMIITTAGLLASRRIPPQMSLENAGTRRILRIWLKSRARFASSWWSTMVPDPWLSSNVVTNSIWYIRDEFHGHHSVATNHSYPAYVASTPRTSDNSNNADDLPWNSHSTDHFHQLSVAPHYHHSTSFSLPGAHVIDGELDSSAARGISQPHPFLFSYRSNPRTSPAIQGSSAAQMREQLQTQQQHHVYNNQRQHHVNGPNLASPLVSMTRRGLQPLHMTEQNVGFFIYPPPQPRSTSGEPERDQFNHAWERDWFPYFPVPSIHRIISSFWHRHL
ncbi:hypothetical protein N665_5860s0002 [Sinapis alba]|nr:hypothetical protein N665_5860s0002 [Sinapis alba]